MQNLPTTLSLVVLTLLSLAAAALAVGLLLRRPRLEKYRARQDMLAWTIALGSGLVFLYRWAAVHQRWQPLEAHVDGLLLVTTILAAVLPLLIRWSRMQGLYAFALPPLTLLLAWAICASAWTFHPFAIGSVWTVVHSLGVYLGTLFVAIAASAAGLFLYAQRRLRHKPADPAAGRLASLEAIESLMVRMAGLGFGLLTLGVVSGFIIVASEHTRLGSHWWVSPKVVVGSLAWLVFLLVLNTRHAATFRGARAAWLSIAGFVLVLATYALATRLPDAPAPAVPPPPPVPAASAPTDPVPSRATDPETP